MADREILHLYFQPLENADSNKSGQNRRGWLEILEMLWSVMRLIFNASSVTLNFFYVFNIILSVKVLKKICAWELLGANVLKLVFCI